MLISPSSQGGKKISFMRPSGSILGEITKIVVKNINDVNIYDLLDRVVRQIENIKINKIPELEKKLEILRSKSKKPQFSNDRKITLDEIRSIEIEIESLRSDKNKNKFMDETKNLMQIYEETCDGKDIKDRLISTFVNICKKFVDIDIEKRNSPKNLCLECGFDLSGLLNGDEASELTCPICGLITQVFTQFNLSKTVENSEYEDRDNYMKAILKFQGKKEVNFSDNLFKDLDDFFTSRGLPKGEEIRNLVKINGRKSLGGIIGKKILRKALHNKGHQNHYDDVNLIVSDYWDWELPDISHLESILIEDYDKTERVFKRIKGKKRKATINVQWRLKHNLLGRKYPVQDDDFKIIETREILEMYSRWWETMVSECGDNSLICVKTI